MQCQVVPPREVSTHGPDGLWKETVGCWGGEGLSWSRRPWFDNYWSTSVGGLKDPLGDSRTSSADNLDPGGPGCPVSRCTGGVFRPSSMSLSASLCRAKVNKQHSHITHLPTAKMRESTLPESHRRQVVTKKPAQQMRRINGSVRNLAVY